MQSDLATVTVGCQARPGHAPQPWQRVLGVVAALACLSLTIDYASYVHTDRKPK